MSLSRRGFLGAALAGLGVAAFPAKLRHLAAAAVNPGEVALPRAAPVYYNLSDPEVTAAWSRSLYQAVSQRSSLFEASFAEAQE